jgi:hypothetical protein
MAAICFVREIAAAGSSDDAMASRVGRGRGAQVGLAPATPGKTRSDPARSLLADLLANYSKRGRTEQHGADNHRPEMLDFSDQTRRQYISQYRPKRMQSLKAGSQFT